MLRSLAVGAPAVHVVAALLPALHGVLSHSPPLLGGSALSPLTAEDLQRLRLGSQTVVAMVYTYRLWIPLAKILSDCSV